MLEYSKLDDQAADLLAVAIIKQACLDYMNDCFPGKYKRKHGMDDYTYNKYVTDSEIERKKRKREEVRFFNGKWFEHLRKDDRITGEMLMKRLEYMKRKGMTLYMQDIGHVGESAA